MGRYEDFQRDGAICVRGAFSAEEVALAAQFLRDSPAAAIAGELIGDDATHAPRAWRTSPEFPRLADELPAGAPMEHPLFPIVWAA